MEEIDLIKDWAWRCRGSLGVVCVCGGGGGGFGEVGMVGMPDTLRMRI